MFGILRYLLAIMVVAHHFIGLKYSGRYAVYIFFVVSGFLMTTIINTSYKENIKGYVINRFLRIYPSYFIAVVLTAITIWMIPEVMNINVWWSKGLPGSVYDLALYDVEFIPQAWTIRVELIMYMVMIFTCTSRERVKAWVYTSVVLMLLVSVSGMDYYARYESIFSASLPFSLGSFLFYQEKRDPNYWMIGICSVLLLIIPVAETLGLLDKAKSIFGSLGLLLATLLGYLILNELRLVRPKDTLKKIDSFLGELSYPIYLTHLTIGSVLIVYGMSFRTVGMFLASLPLVNLVAWVFAKCVDGQIEKVRKIFKNRTSAVVLRAHSL